MIEVSIAGGRVLAVPSLPGRAVFARAVRRAFLRARPQAVAVELAPQAAVHLAAWLRELAAEPPGGPSLPCMLGLIRVNRRLHPDFRDASLRLQERCGLPLHQVPSALLRRELRYAGLSLLCLSATDALIEGVRSAVQHGVEVHGVDREDFAAGEPMEVLCEDPIGATQDLAAYVERNAACAAAGRDPLIDGRREELMAMRLKGLAQRHGSVLFVGRLAHWSELERRLRDPGLPAATPSPPAGDGGYLKVVVDPAIAVHHMDVLPDYTPYYEGVRTLSEDDLGGSFDVVHEVDGKLLRAYQHAAADAASRAEGVPEEGLSSFQFYLDNLCQLRQQLVPDLASALAAAAALVSADFAERLGRQLMAASRISWVQPADRPDLAYLRAVPFDLEEQDLAGTCYKVELVRAGGRQGPYFLDGVIGSPGEAAFALGSYLDAGTGAAGAADEKDPEDGDDDRRSWVWPPCEHLFFGTAFAIAEQAHTHLAKAASEPFNGSLHAGIDTKATLRAAARGEPRTYVKTAARGRPLSLREALSDPFVYIFQKPEANRSLDSFDWELLQAGALEEHHFRTSETRRQFREIRERRGDAFISSVTFGEQRDPPAELAGCKAIRNLRLLWGSVAFGNPCTNLQQCVRWLEAENFSCCPVLRSGEMSELVNMYDRERGVSLDLANWPETLVRIGIQQARRRVLVMAPDRGAITARARSEARRRHVSIDTVPLSFISADRVAAVRRQYYVFPADPGATRWPEEVIARLGPSDANIDLLPSWIRAQAAENV
jgi:hypothetical protein